MSDSRAGRRPGPEPRAGPAQGRGPGARGLRSLLPVQHGRRRRCPLGVQVVRYRRICARLSGAGLVTRAGSGIRRIIRLVREATGRDVEIKVRDFEVLLSIPRKPAQA